MMSLADFKILERRAGVVSTVVFGTAFALFDVVLPDLLRTFEFDFATTTSFLPVQHK
jgi:hypothetical protein